MTLEEFCIRSGMNLVYRKGEGYGYYVSEGHFVFGYTSKRSAIKGWLNDFIDLPNPKELMRAIRNLKK